MTPDDPRHATPAGYQRHRNVGQQPCGPCTDAHTAYGREWARNSPAQQRLGRTNHARRHVIAAVRDLAPDLYARLWQEGAAEWDRAHKEDA